MLSQLGKNRGQFGSILNSFLVRWGAWRCLFVWNDSGLMRKGLWYQPHPIIWGLSLVQFLIMLVIFYPVPYVYLNVHHVLQTYLALLRGYHVNSPERRNALPRSITFNNHVLAAPVQIYTHTHIHIRKQHVIPVQSTHSYYVKTWAHTTHATIVCIYIYIFGHHSPPDFVMLCRAVFCPACPLFSSRMVAILLAP